MYAYLLHLPYLGGSAVQHVVAYSKSFAELSTADDTDRSAKAQVRSLKWIGTLH